MFIAAAHRAFRFLGCDFFRISSYTSPALRLALLAKRLESTLLFDIGANEGQFAAETLISGYPGRIVSVEPGSGPHAILCHRASKHPRWQVPQRCAIGERKGVATLHIAGNSVSSSLLPMTASHSDAAPSSRYVDSETVEVLTCDMLFDEYARPDDRGIILKVDVQGHEAAVLSGAARSLPRVAAVLVELSLTELYEGQPLLRDQLAALEAMGFDLWDLDRGFMNPQTGQLLQVDATLVRRGIS